MYSLSCFFFELYRDHRDLHVLTHSFPTRRSSELAPSRYAPSADPEAARGRAQVVIRLMKETGKISAATANMADPRNAKIAPQPRQNSVRYFTDWALAQLDEYVGDTKIGRAHV